MTLSRLVLYYPVSALVTLFANILQNPQDARARSDIKLMNLVVNFLSMLVTDESNGSVRRMLSVCAEFERIARVVLDKAEKEALSKRKRKVTVSEGSNINNHGIDTPNRSDTTAFNPEKPTDISSPFSPIAQQQSTERMNMRAPEIVSPRSNDIMTSAFGDVSSAGIPAVFNPEVTFADQAAMQATTSPNSDGQFIPFQQPFVPQDLWQMPMTLEWDWADFSTVNLPNIDQPDMFQQAMHNGM
jgi:hypothetical protein